MTVVLRNTSAKSIIVVNTETGKKLSVGPGVVISGEGYRGYLGDPSFTVVLDKNPKRDLTSKAIAKQLARPKVVVPAATQPMPKTLRHPVPTGTAMRVRVPPGIGDVSWIHSKLVTLNRPIIYCASKTNLTRVLAYCEIVTNVQSVEQGDFTYNQVLKQTIDPTKSLPSDFVDGYVALNDFLAPGRRIEEAFPGMGTDLHYPFNLDTNHIITADRIGRSFGNMKMLGVFTSSWGPVRAWKAWHPLQWLQFITEFMSKNDGWLPILFGATFDKAYVDELHAMLERDKIPHVPVVGHHLGVVVSLLQRYIKYLVGFESGIPVLANVCKVPTFMLTPTHVPHGTLKYAWPDMSIPFRAEFWDQVPKIYDMVTESMREIKLIP